MNCISSGQNLVWHSDIGATQTGTGFVVVVGHGGDGDVFGFRSPSPLHSSGPPLMRTEGHY